MCTPKLKFLILSTIIIAIGLTNIQAEPPANKKPNMNPSALTSDNITWIDANKILMFVTNHGNFGRDLTDMFNQDAGTFYPYQDTSLILSDEVATLVVYAGGLVIGGKVDGEIRVAFADYSDEYVPGPMLNGTFQADRPEFKVYKLYSDSLEGSPNEDYLNWPVEQGAPVDSSGKPAMRGEQMLWTVFNDADPNQHTNVAGETSPLGIEIKQTVWASDESGSINIPIPQDLPVTHIGFSSGRVIVEIIDFDLITEHEYQITFEADSTFGSVWDLVNITTGTMILENQTVGTVEVDGAFRIGVYAPTKGVKFADQYSHPEDSSNWGWSFNGTRQFSWAGGADGLGFEAFRGALGWGGPGWHVPVPGSELVNVLLKLAPVDADGNFDPNHPDVSYAYRYLRSPGAPAQPEFGPYIIDPDPPGGSYGFQDYEKSCPLSAWNMNVDPPVRLTVGYLENNAINGLVDGQYWPGYYGDYDNTAVNGPREWLWIYLDEYSETLNPDYALNAIENPMPIMYWATWARRNEEPWPGGDEFSIFPDTADNISPADTFTFTLVAPEVLTSGPEGMTIYMQYELENKSGDDISDMYIGLWTDPDLGDASDDLVGCDPENNLFYCYNYSNSDRYFGYFPPAVGFKVLQGPLVPSSGDTAWFDGALITNHKNLPLSGFSSYMAPGIDPNNYNETYNRLQGLYNNGDYHVYDGNTTTFMYAGDPVTGTGDLDVDPADRRMMGSVGPFNMAAGDKQIVVYKLAVGQGMNRLESITNLRETLNSSTWLDGNTECCGFWTDGFTGNTNCDGQGLRDLADIIRLIDNVYVLKTKLCCPENGNINGDVNSLIDIADITKLIDHAYISKVETAPCL